MEIKGLGEGQFQSLLQEKGKKTTGADFGDVIKEFLKWVNEEQQKATEVKESVLAGEEVPLHRMVIELEKAGVALNLLIEIRNRLLEGFQELMRMQV